MVKLVKTKEGQEVLELSRFQRIWVCSECQKEFHAEVPNQCPCGAQDKVFIEKTLPSVKTPRRLFVVESNIIYEASHIPKGSIISLCFKDNVTKNLLSRKLISEVTYEIQEEVKV